MTSDRHVIAAACVALATFLGLAVVAFVSDRWPGDAWLTHRVQSVDIAAFSTALDLTEDAAEFPMYVIAVVLASLLLLYWGGTRPAAVMLAVPVMAWLVPVSKAAVGRPRPSSDLVDVALPQPDDMSFPSGHAFNAMLVYGLILCLAAAYIPVRWMRLTVQAACVWIIVLTSIERVYVGHHWPSDVLGGLLLGGLVAAGFVAIDRRSVGLAEQRMTRRSTTALARAAPRG